MYTDDGNIYPAALLFDTGTFSIGSTGPKVTTISQPVERRQSLLARAIDVSHGSVAAARLAGRRHACRSWAHAAWSGTTRAARRPSAGISLDAGVGALPDPFPAGATPL